MQWLIYFVIQLPFIVSSHENNVCENIPDYKTIHSNKHCRYNPNVLSDLPHIVERNGYPLEKHKVTTKDGYILTVYRLFNQNSTNSHSRQPVIVQHGLAASAVFWVLQNNKSLAFFLYDNGYDVWLPTFRGGTDSTQHVFLNEQEPKFWKFGFHEMAIFDLPAIIDHINDKTKQKGNIIYIGHSMGTTVSYVYASMMPCQAEENLKGIISLAPIAYLAHVKGLYAVAASYADTLEALLKVLGIFAIGNDPTLNRLVQSLCSSYPNVILCTSVLALGSGLSLKQTSVDLMPVITSYFPSGVSVQTMVHYSQLIRNGGRFRQYDYGKQKNWLIYNASSPPDYEVWKITLPVYLFAGDEDFLATKEDVSILEKRLTSARKVEKYYVDFAHNDFFLAKNFDKFYKTLLPVMKNMEHT